eukprot:7012791-Pyramimonas_sp.AAC.1
MVKPFTIAPILLELDRRSSVTDHADLLDAIQAPRISSASSLRLPYIIFYSPETSIHKVCALWKIRRRAPLSLLNSEF